MSWSVVAVLTLAYWIILFIRMRVRGRQEFDRAFDQSAMANAGRESFEVVVSTEVRPLRVALVVLVVPIALVVIHMIAARG